LVTVIKLSTEKVPFSFLMGMSENEDNGCIGIQADNEHRDNDKISFWSGKEDEYSGL
jgi:hypothetical protein